MVQGDEKLLFFFFFSGRIRVWQVLHPKVFLGVKKWMKYTIRSYLSKFMGQNSYIFLRLLYSFLGLVTVNSIELLCITWDPSSWDQPSKVSWKFPCQVGNFPVKNSTSTGNLHGFISECWCILHVSIQTWMISVILQSAYSWSNLKFNQFKGHNCFYHYLLSTVKKILYTSPKMLVMAVDFSSPSTICKDKRHK